MTTAAREWGAYPSERYERLASAFRPIFERISEDAVKRELEHRLPLEELGQLREAGLTSVRLPVEQGGVGATLPELFGFLIELSQADPNLTNSLRSHFAFVEDTLNAPEGEWRARWLERIRAHETVGGAHTEVGSSVIGTFSTAFRRRGQGYVVSGRKFYTTGSLYAPWLKVTATNEDGASQIVLVPADAEGVRIVDDWDGFGQKLTASGTVYLDDVFLDASLIRPLELGRLPYATAFVQLVHLATLAGIGRAAARDLSRLVLGRERVYARGNNLLSREDPQILQIVGRVRGAAFAASAIVVKIAESLDRAYRSLQDEGAVRSGVHALSDTAELEVSQSVTVVTSLILDATTLLFDALGASAVRIPAGLDRHWRNARTITSHNPRVYHDRIIGEYSLSGRFERVMPGVGALAKAAGT